jgi:undecaprenyl-diphosphatase
MNVFYAVLLGVLQGLTEFLPVSSSGHLVIAQSLIPGFSQPGVLFDVILHFGTLFAVLFYFRSKLLKLGIRYLEFLVIGTIPAVVIGFLFKDAIESLFGSVQLVGIALIVSGLVNFITYRAEGLTKSLNFKNTFLVGVAQALAIVPGISRSGSTIFAAVKQGIKPEEAVEFSFLLSVPAVFGANVLEILGNVSTGVILPTPYILGFLAAFASGFFAIGVVLRFLLSRKFNYFAVYCFILGALVLLL